MRMAPINSQTGMLSHQGMRLFGKKQETQPYCSRYGFVGESMSLGVGFEVTKGQARPRLSLALFLSLTCTSGCKALSYCSNATPVCFLPRCSWTNPSEFVSKPPIQGCLLQATLVMVYPSSNRTINKTNSITFVFSRFWYKSSIKVAAVPPLQRLWGVCLASSIFWSQNSMARSLIPPISDTIFISSSSALCVCFVLTKAKCDGAHLCFQLLKAEEGGSQVQSL